MPQVPSDSSLKIFSDLGAGQQNLLFERGLTEKEVVIIDHHVSQPCERTYTPGELPALRPLENECCRGLLLCGKTPGRGKH